MHFLWLVCFMQRESATVEKAEEVTNKAIKQIMTEFDALLKKHPHLRAKAAAEMKAIASKEKSKRSFSRINKRAVTTSKAVGFTVSNDRAITKLEQRLSKELLGGEVKGP